LPALSDFAASFRSFPSDQLVQEVCLRSCFPIRRARFVKSPHLSYVSSAYVSFHRVIDDGCDWKSVCMWSRVHAIAIFRLTRGVASEQIWPKQGRRHFRRQHAPRCDVTASQLDARRSRANQPGFLFWRTQRRARICADSHGLGSGIQLEAASASRKKFGSSSAGTMPSGRTPRLYSARRFFHFRNSVRFCGSIRISTRRRLASSRFIS
jgi:hypothetical protein